MKAGIIEGRRKRGHGILAALAALVALVLIAVPQPALAAESSDSLAAMGNDRLWAGQELNLTGTKVNNDLLAAGQVLVVSDTEVGGSARIAGQTIVLTNVTAQESITVAGQTVTISDAKANAVAAAGQQASFDGSCSSLTLYANDIVIDGTVDGDVWVGGNDVTVGEHAKITGTLHVSAPEEPKIATSAVVGNVDFTKEEEDSFSDEQMQLALEGMSGMLTVLFAIAGFIGTIVVSTLAEWLFSRHTAAAADMVRTRTGAMIGSGVVGTLVAPVAILIMCVLVITLPVTVCVTFALIAIAAASAGFASASLARVAFPKLGRFKGALALGAIVGIVKAVPILSSLVHLTAYVYLLGYVLQSIYLGLHKDS